MLLFDRMMLLSFVLDVAWAVQSLILIPQLLILLPQCWSGWSSLKVRKLDLIRIWSGSAPVHLDGATSRTLYSPLRHSLYSLVWHLHDGMNLLCPDHHSFLELNLCDSYHKSTRWRLLWWWCCNRPWMRRPRWFELLWQVSSPNSWTYRIYWTIWTIYRTILWFVWADSSKLQLIGRSYFICWPTSKHPFISLLKRTGRRRVNKLKISSNQILLTTNCRTKLTPKESWIIPSYDSLWKRGSVKK